MWSCMVSGADCADSDTGSLCIQNCTAVFSFIATEQLDSSLVGGNIEIYGNCVRCLV